MQEAKDSSAIENIVTTHDELFQDHLFPERLADPLIKMAYDGKGRTGRILNLLYLVKEGLLGIRVLYLSRYIAHTKSDYCQLLQTVRETDRRDDWVLSMRTAIEATAADTIETMQAIRVARLDIQRRIRVQYKCYSQDLISNLFTHPYTKIEYIEQDLKVSRLTAAKYLEALTTGGFLQKVKKDAATISILPVNAILTCESMQDAA